MSAANANKRLINAMLQADFYNHPVAAVELMETHISLVFLTGHYAYKIKKPVNFGFLDFTQLDRRKYYCEEEIRLNSRLAPDIYLDVVPVTESDNTLQLNGQGTVIDYAVRMRQFDAHGLFSKLIDSNRINLPQIDILAERLADFHATIAISHPDDEFGSTAAVMDPVNQNFSILRPLLSSDQQRAELNTIQQYTFDLFKSLSPILQQRKQSGHIRECHGDLHLGNIALSDGEIIIFDGIEFNDSFRWIDTMSDIAFLVMDLQDHQKHNYATHFLNRYLELSGDYEGLAVLRFYQLYRAMVRAKVAALRLQQETTESGDYVNQQQKLQNYINLALEYTRASGRFLAITRGISGSGKSWVAERLADLTSAIRIRSDTERKRLFAAATNDLYGSDITRKVYAHLSTLAKDILHYGYPVIADATFLKADNRLAFYQLATDLQVPYYILHCHAATALLEQRIRQRQSDSRNISDADIAVMHHQLATAEAMSESENRYCIDIDTGREIDIHSIRGRLRENTD